MQLQQKYQVNSNYYSDQIRLILGAELFENLKKQMESDSKIGLDYTWQEVSHIYRNCRYLLAEMSLYEAIEKARSGERALRGFEGLHASLGNEFYRTEEQIDNVLKRFFSQDEIIQVVMYCGGYPSLKSLDEKSFSYLITKVEDLMNKFTVNQVCSYLWTTRSELFGQDSLEQ